MQKPVRSIIASARVYLRGASELKMPSESLRLLLHQILEQQCSYAIRENKDFYTHELSADLDYDEESHGYSLTVDTIEYPTQYPIALMYQDLTADEHKGNWRKIQFVKYSQFLQMSGEGTPAASVIGNNFQSIHDQVVRLNLQPEWVQKQRFRIAFRYFPSEVLDYGDIVPFPSEHTTMLELMLAQSALQLVKDNSPDWDKFYVRQSAYLNGKVQEAQGLFLDWLKRDIENQYVTPDAFHYVRNNALQVGQRRDIRYEARTN